MPQIHVLDKLTIDQIAAGEVIERPSSVVKELVENAIDAGATAVTVEVRNGGIDFIRVTDNGCGIEQKQIRSAFLRHSTSKIENAEDLQRIHSLGFRGEALSSIAAVTRLELITKRKEDPVGSSYEIHGGEEISLSEIGAPDGSTFLVQDLFYNTPARRKFLKTPMTEASYIAELLEKMALSHPDVSFRFIANQKTRLASAGNGKVRDLIYSIYGRETARELLPLDTEIEGIRISGFIGKPVVAKGNRGFENYFVNGRYVKDRIITKAIEEAYQPFMMLHRYPLTVLYLDMPSDSFDVNVHPQKMELRFRNEGQIYDCVLSALRAALSHKEFIVDALAEEEKKEENTPQYQAPEPFEEKRLREEKPQVLPKRTDGPEILREKTASEKPNIAEEQPSEQEPFTASDRPEFPDSPKFSDSPYSSTLVREPEVEYGKKAVQQNLFDTKLLSEEGYRRIRILGQVFETYWVLQMDDKLYIMDQHAAHEKVLYERKMKELAERKHPSQMVSPPVMISVTAREELLLNRYMDAFSALGYEISGFGGKEYAISAVPYDLYGLDIRALFEEMLGEMEDEFSEKKPEMILSKLASMSCKAAVKGENALSFEEADALIRELMTLQNPYACPHGRPTLISFSRTELDKKFKRIV